jgi:hypothetical protein
MVPIIGRNKQVFGLKQQDRRWSGCYGVSPAPFMPVPELRLCFAFYLGSSAGSPKV